MICNVLNTHSPERLRLNSSFEWKLLIVDNLVLFKYVEISYFLGWNGGEGGLQKIPSKWQSWKNTVFDLLYQCSSSLASLENKILTT